MLTVLLTLADTPPEDNDVVAGGWGAVVLVGLIIAVVLLGFSLFKQLRKVEAADKAGVYGRDDDRASDPADTPSASVIGETATEVPPDENTDDKKP
jgi:hypothetical protein